MASLIKVIPVRGYVELLAKSNFSFLQGASHPEELVRQAAQNRYSGIGICDVGGLYGVARGYQAAKSQSSFEVSEHVGDEFKYVFGSEIPLCDEGSVALYPMNMHGYTNLCQLLTKGKRRAAKGKIDLCFSDLEETHQDLIAILLPPFSVQRYLRFESIFQDRLYLPVCRDLTWASREDQKAAFELEVLHGAKLFVSTRALVHDFNRKPLLDVLTCIQHHTTLDKVKTILEQNSERRLKSIPELCDLWGDRLDLINATMDIAEKLQFSLQEIRYRYPRSHLPDQMSPGEYLRHLTALGVKIKFPTGASPKIGEIIRRELDLIIDMQYEDYFLTLYEICEFAKQKKILFQGRGSAANSVVCFCLGLTSVDPNEVDLLFERFLSKERGEPPDIDIDFEHERREEVIQHIYEKYNEQHAAMVCTVIRFRSKMAFRETAKVFGLSLPLINKIIKHMGRGGLKRLQTEPDLHLKFGLQENYWNLLVRMSSELYGFPRHLGIHTGGFIITQDPLMSMVPVEKATMNGRYIIQWNKDDVAILKLMKIDILSLGMLSALRKCFDLLRRHKNLDLNLATIPRDDGPTYDMISRAETVGVFQIESRAQMNTLPRMKPQNFYDIVIEVALIRPGPLQGGMVHPYLKRRAGLEKVTYAHPDLEKVLGKTYGIPIFQEQVMRIAIVAAGFTPGEADELRRVMSSAWRKKVTMNGVRERIINGMQERGISTEYAEQIYKTIEGFSNYGFPESHAASFALLTYASSWLKCHHPEVFICGLLNSQPMGFYAPRTLIAEAQSKQVEFLPLSVQQSDYDYSLQDLKVRVGLRGIVGIPKKALMQIEEERKNNGLYLSLKDFVQRSKFPRSVLIQLAAAGAFHEFHAIPRELIWQIQAMSLDENSFFWAQDASTGDNGDDEEDHLPSESNWDELRREYDTKGFSIEHHPMSVLRTYLNEKNETFRKNKMVPYGESKNFINLKNGSKVRVAGLVSVTQRPPTAKGMCFITLEDEFGFINVVIHPDVYQKDRTTIYGSSLLEVRGVIEKSGSIINVKAERVFPLG